MSKFDVGAGYCSRRRRSFSMFGSLAGFCILSASIAWAGDDQPNKAVLIRGAELFAKEWLPGDSNGTGGDGLGPMYNETSCIACHHQGGPGGAGPTSTNVEILTDRSVSRSKSRRAAPRLPCIAKHCPPSLRGRSRVQAETSQSAV